MDTFIVGQVFTLLRIVISIGLRESMSKNITESERWHLWVMLNIGYINYGDEITLISKDKGTKKTFIVHSKSEIEIKNKWPDLN